MFWCERPSKCVSGPPGNCFRSFGAESRSYRILKRADEGGGGPLCSTRHSANFTSSRSKMLDNITPFFILSGGFSQPTKSARSPLMCRHASVIIRDQWCRCHTAVILLLCEVDSDGTRYQLKMLDWIGGTQIFYMIDYSSRSLSVE